MERASAQERARGIAQIIGVTVEGLEREITDGLLVVPKATLLDSLLLWETENPTIRNVFVWLPGIGLQYPTRGKQASLEQMRFIARYQTLFAARGAWLPLDSGVLTDLSRSTKTGKTSSFPQQTYDTRRLQRAPSKLQQRQSAQMGQSVTQAKAGWMPWFTDNRLHLLGWAQRDPSDVVVGVELETIALVSQLIEKFPRDETAGIIYALVDDAGALIHQLGRSPIQPTMAPALEISLAPHLPHWRVAVYLEPQTVGLRSSNAFVVLAGLLLATLIVAILLGGALLTRQAYSHWQDAQQKSSFVSNVSHELKTPLTTIRMYAELLNEGTIKDSAKKRQYLQVIVSEAERLTRLVNNVLGFSRLEQGRMKYRIQDFDVVDFVHSFLNVNEMRVREAGMFLHPRIPRHSLLVRVDRDALEQTFLNILDNAIKYAADGGSLEIAVSVNGPMCEIRFLDRGPGIPESQRDKIFEKFQRVDDALTAGKVGTGLGLTIGRYMMRDLKGDLVFEPRESGGSCFVVSMPLASARNPE